MPLFEAYPFIKCSFVSLFFFLLSFSFACITIYSYVIRILMTTIIIIMMAYDKKRTSAVVMAANTKGLLTDCLPACMNEWMNAWSVLTMHFSLAGFGSVGIWCLFVWVCYAIWWPRIVMNSVCEITKKKKKKNACTQPFKVFVFCVVVFCYVLPILCFPSFLFSYYSSIVLDKQ